jgi:drug/metabolite transporter (DMT)-like permease
MSVRPSHPTLPATALFTSLALVAFASNSILARLALRSGQMDAASFTSVRLVAGALMLGLLVRIQSGAWRPRSSSGPVGPVALIAYAVAFSFAYVRIGAAVGALILFGAVQMTMVGWGIARGERPSARVWLGAAITAGGLVWLTLPSVGRPDPAGSGLMALAGVMWGVYSLVGRTAGDALASNARSFFWAVPPALALEAARFSTAAATSRGILLAATSGAITSGLGYAVWYRALRGLTATQAAVLQLGVPVIAGFAAVALLREPASPRLVASGAAVLAGLALVVSTRAS